MLSLIILALCVTQSVLTEGLLKLRLPVVVWRSVSAPGLCTFSAWAVGQSVYICDTCAVMRLFDPAKIMPNKNRQPHLRID